MGAKKRVVVLGGGMVGSVLAKDLAQEPDIAVTVADIDQKALDRLDPRTGITAIEADLGDLKKISLLAAKFDLVVGALPGFMGYQTLQAVLEAGRNYCDISFMPEDAWDLTELAEVNGVTAVVDCGVAPGLSHMLVGYAAEKLEAVDRVAIYVGGLPEVRTLPFQYKAPFSPADVIEEYVRPARLKKAGKMVLRPALSDPELLDFPEVGTLEAFLTDGLRSLIYTVASRTMVEKTMRWPGHRDLMMAFRNAGFLSEEEMDVNGVTVRPLDVTTRLLFPLWAFEEGEVDITVMRVIVEGERNGEDQTFQWDLFDRADPATGFSSMARTTAFPAAIAARMLLKGEISEPGVVAPEQLGAREGVLERFLAELKDRGVTLRTAGNPL
jgi:saccharopine dehydrogenase-like NADP-dependent oxidoreductase